MEWRGKGPGHENTGTQGHKDRGMGRDKNRNRDTGTVIGVGPEVKGPRHKRQKGEPKQVLRYIRKGTGTETQGTVTVIETRLFIEGRLAFLSCSAPIGGKVLA